mmetsp:Transcript_15758/g.23875  ORF Transcript_15758/g.23875 Transcript_15758/m.23875 type:complete len:305 (-) Transcript_15758:158-1072(-)
MIHQVKKIAFVLCCALIAKSCAFFATEKLSHSMRKTSHLFNNENKVVVALTREEGKNEKLSKMLKSTLADFDVTIEEIPCIAHADGDDLPRLTSHLVNESFDYVTVTSPEAARVLATAWNCNSARKMPAVAAVGKATQATLESLNIPVDFCPSKATAETLVTELPDVYAHENSRTTKVLYPASAKAMPTLQNGLSKRGFNVTRLNTYDTVVATWSQAQKERSKHAIIACFGSPSAVKGWLQNTDITGEDQKVFAACIGETSAKACREFGFSQSNIFCPDQPGIPGWAVAVKEAVESAELALKRS